MVPPAYSPYPSARTAPLSRERRRQRDAEPRRVRQDADHRCRPCGRRANLHSKIVKKRGDAMSAQLEDSPKPVAARQPRPLRAAQLPPARALGPATPVAREDVRPKKAPPTLPDPDRGTGLLLSFVGALSVMVADVVLIGAVDRSWILIPGFAVLLGMTAIVFVGIMRLLADGAEDTTPDAR